MSLLMDDKKLPFYSKPFVLVAVVGAFALAAPFALQWQPFASGHWWISLGSPAWFIFPALLPAFLIAVFHVVTAQDRLGKTRELVRDYIAHRRELARRKGLDPVTVPLTEPVTKGPVSALAANAILTAVFLFVAFIHAYMPNGPGADGIVYAGLGAYVAVMYTMINRLFATAITSRFLMASALRAASAIVLGYVFSMVGVKAIFASAPAADFVFFLTGLFQGLVFSFLRKRAGTLFGAAPPAEENLPVTLVQGVDEISADLLTEYGVSDLQHLATAEPGELCMRTLLPLLRVIDWIDQAMLITYLGRDITAARALGVNDMTGLTLASDDTLRKIEQKTGRALADIARRFKDEFFVVLMTELREGRKLESETPASAQTLAIAASHRANVARRHNGA